jgi:hypothetical protein
MATTSARSQQASGAAVQPALAKEVAAQKSPRKASGYGLPCAKCHLYYPADLDACPICRHKERVSVVAPRIPPKPVLAEPEAVPDSDAIEREREDFLRQFKSQLIQAHSEVVNAPAAVCKFGDNHGDETAIADVCTGCYEQLQERVEVCEVALHMETKDAAQIIYDAVWADPSDPGKTYQNAANALLSELRKRAGISAPVGPFQPLAN